MSVMAISTTTNDTRSLYYLCLHYMFMRDNTCLCNSSMSLCNNQATTSDIDIISKAVRQYPKLYGLIYLSTNCMCTR